MSAEERAMEKRRLLAVMVEAGRAYGELTMIDAEPHELRSIRLKFSGGYTFTYPVHRGWTPTPGQEEESKPATGPARK